MCRQQDAPGELLRGSVALEALSLSQPQARSENYLLSSNLRLSVLSRLQTQVVLPRRLFGQILPREEAGWKDLQREGRCWGHGTPASVLPWDRGPTAHAGTSQTLSSPDLLLPPHFPSFITPLFSCKNSFPLTEIQEQPFLVAEG